MFNNENQHDTSSSGVNYDSFKIAVEKIGPTSAIYGEVPPIKDNARYIDGSFTIFLDGELVNQLTVYTKDSNSLMEKYTEAMARIVDYFEGVRGARCNFHALKDGIRCVSVTFPDKYLADGNNRPKLNYNGEQFMQDLRVLKNRVQYLRNQRGGN